ncbi:MAG: glycosyltransferase family 2 protein [Lachnospiraceae bacterium]|nr:glycosyltransferase family 2 protein [Lachnospiraceae bacterium]MBQ6259315.1 glycosyltransferase family 2 protein [Lachnospiraceae bacterium]
MQKTGKIVRYSLGKKYNIDSFCITASDGGALLLIDGWQIERDASLPFYVRIDGSSDGVKRTDNERDDVRSTFGLPGEGGYYSFTCEYPLHMDPSRMFTVEIGREGKKPFFKKSISIEMMLYEQKEEIICLIDSVQRNGGKTYITGWGYSRSLEIKGSELVENLSELDISLKEGDYFLRREDRVDVKLKGFPKGQKVGFVLRVENKKDGIYELVMKAPGGMVKELQADIRLGDGYYLEFMRKCTPSKEELEKQSAASFSYSPLISIPVLVSNQDISEMKRTIDSVLSQSYRNFELCLFDASDDDNEKRIKVLQEYGRKDERVKVEILPEKGDSIKNKNKAFSSSKGDFVALLSCSDMLEPDALYLMAEAMQDKDVDMIYTDEDRFNGTTFFDPDFKSDFSLDQLRGTFYIGNFTVIRKSLVSGNEDFFDETYEGAEVYDLILRCCEKAKKVAHIPKVLYHSLSGDDEDITFERGFSQETGRRAIEASLKRLHVDGTVSDGKEKGLYVTKYPVKKNDLISIIIPSHDHASVLRTCIESIEERSTYDNYEIILIENGSTEKELFDYYETLKADSRVRILYWDKGFNFSAINNYGVREAKGDYLLFLNNDIEIKTPDWLEEMLSNFQRNEGIGAVGVRLLYPDTTIQHAGVIIRLGGIAGHGFSRMDCENTGYFGRAVIKQDLTAVTAACMMTSREVFSKVGGFEETLAVAFNDVDLCLKIRKAGYRIIYDPDVTHIHYESLSRGHETDSPEKQKRFDSEKRYMYDHWREIIDNGDPFYNKNLTITRGDFSIRKEDSDHVRIF